MNLRNRSGFAWYFKLYHFVAKERLRQDDVPHRDIHVQLATVLSTGLLMWAYAILAGLTITSKIPFIVGFLCSLVHLLSPLLWRVTSNAYVIANTLLLAGIIHQATFAFFTGGINSFALIWVGILPMLGGIMCGRKGAITWVIMSTSVSLLYLFLYLFGFEFPFVISSIGYFWGQALIVFGWIFLSTLMIIVYNELWEYTEERLIEQGHEIEDLFRVLFHDLANPLGRVSVGLTVAKKQVPQVGETRGFEIAAYAADSMMEITQNVRRMYAASKGKTRLDLHFSSLKASIDYIRKVYAPELEKKNLTLVYQNEDNPLIKVRVEPVSFNNQVLSNVISNAIKFSPVGGKITIKAEPDDDDTIALGIEDQGIGMSPEVINQLFDLSTKTTRTGTMGESGTGFGMHIMKSFVQMYGGHVSVTSRESTNSSDAPSGTTIKLMLKGKWA